MKVPEETAPEAYLALVNTIRERSDTLRVAGLAGHVSMSGIGELTILRGVAPYASYELNLPESSFGRLIDGHPLVPGTAVTLIDRVAPGEERVASIMTRGHLMMRRDISLDPLSGAEVQALHANRYVNIESTSNLIRALIEGADFTPSESRKAAEIVKARPGLFGLRSEII